MTDETRIERLKVEIETVEKAFRFHEKAYKREPESKYTKEQYDYFEGIVEGLATALKIIQGEIV